MTLSLLSALARLNIDPWEETAALAAIPKDRAMLKLAAMIGATTRALRNSPDAEATAVRLINLLPGAPGTTVAPDAILLTKSSPSSLAMMVVIGFLIIGACTAIYIDAWPFSTSSLVRSDRLTNSSSSP